MADQPSKTELMRAIRDEVLELKTSPLYEERVKNHVFPVIGEGDHNARLMFVGEAPGRNEAATGRPFCGAAGKILDAMLDSIGVLRSDVYVTNIVKDRPPFNRDPLPEEIAAYGPFLDRQIDIIRPAIVAPLGRFSMRYIMELLGLGDKVISISHMHGRVFDGTAFYGVVKIVPLYHPAATIYNPTLKEDLQADFQVLKSLLTEGTPF